LPEEIEIAVAERQPKENGKEYTPAGPGRRFPEPGRKELRVIDRVEDRCCRNPRKQGASKFGVVEHSLGKSLQQTFDRNITGRRKYIYTLVRERGLYKWASAVGRCSPKKLSSRDGRLPTMEVASVFIRRAL
jgi:hypothetical protein